MSGRVVIGFICLFAGVLSFFYLRYPLQMWNVFLQRGMPGGLTLEDTTKRIVSYVMGCIIGIASIASLIVFIASLVGK
jgi:hypothetical protein